MRVLVVDDDLALADVVAFTMRRSGFEVIMAHDGQVAIERWKEESPDLIILDLNLPKIDGLKVCKLIRDQADTPIIILSVRGEEDDVVKGLELGADDYIVKPFSPRQLVARAEALLRRAKAQPVTSGPIHGGDLILDISRKQVARNDRLLAKLTRLESRLLEILMVNQGQVLTAEVLIETVWGPAGGDRAMLKQLAYRLRKKIELDPSEPAYLITIPGIGYSFSPQESSISP